MVEFRKTSNGMSVADAFSGETLGEVASKFSRQVIPKKNTDLKIKLHKEQLDIFKKKIKKAEVTINKVVITEEKTIVVPVTREELVIEKKIFATENPDEVSTHTRKIRIPLSEERIEVLKHLVVLEDVEIYKRQFQKIEHVESILKKEIIHLMTNGKAKTVEK